MLQEENRKKARSETPAEVKVKAPAEVKVKVPAEVKVPEEVDLDKIVIKKRFTNPFSQKIIFLKMFKY